MQTIPARQDPKFNRQILQTAAWFRKNHKSAQRYLKNTGLVLLGVLALIVFISTIVMYDSSEPSQSRDRIPSYCEANDIAYHPSCMGEYSNQTEEEKLDTSDYMAVLMHNAPLAVFGGFWVANSVTFLLLVLHTANPTLLRIAARRTKKSKETYERMKASAEEEARAQLYVVTGLSANTRNLKVSGCPLARPSNIFTDHIVSLRQAYWTPGTSEQTVAWFTDAYYNVAGQLCRGNTVVVMSPTNDFQLSTNAVDAHVDVDAFTKTLAHDTQVLNKM